MLPDHDPAQGPDQDLLQRLDRISFPTLGHFLEDGFASHAIRTLVPGLRIVGRAVTLRLATPNAFAVNRAIATLRPGDVLVIDPCGDSAHAAIGAVTGTALQCAGARGVVSDGVVTDIAELGGMRLPVFARGTSVLTTKKQEAGGSAVNVPVQCGGVTVHPGWLVLADDNGVLFLPAEVAAAHVDQALASDQAEPAILARLRAGEPASAVLQLAP
ncbi:dimethylmenaquinone methyltransferase [Cupriavidus sp. USMAHM13]|uniref:RraA family protein n=1 Tax=Cupriavidus sp. USMAHM13 TaxID=1389192 RepID=UPI0008A6B7DF|nr:dimethylmenaquinone methyltransferase [Cupriavidus sp. USMAHM13]AOZ01767.1 dimethylmenaquinone methyltransferase [Cupriavidus sp. USMAHM13]